MPEELVIETDQDVKEDALPEQAHQSDSSAPEPSETTDVEQETGESVREEPKTERTVPLSDYIDNRTKSKTKIRERDATISSLRKQIEDLGQKSEQPASAEKELKLEDFDYDTDRYNREVARREARAEFSRLEDSRRIEGEEREAAERLSEHSLRAETYAADNPEYGALMESAGDGWHESQAITAAVIGSEKGPQIEHHLLANPGYANKLRGMSESAQFMELGALVERLGSASSKTGATRNVSKAPEPIETVSGGSSSPSDWRLDGSLDTKDYYDRMMAEK